MAESLAATGAETGGTPVSFSTTCRIPHGRSSRSKCDRWTTNHSSFIAVFAVCGYFGGQNSAIHLLLHLRGDRCEELEILKPESEGACLTDKTDKHCQRGDRGWELDDKQSLGSRSTRLTWATISRHTLMTECCEVLQRIGATWSITTQHTKIQK